MHPHWLFIGNVAAHLVALMSGIASFLMATWEHWKKRKIESRVFFFVGVICLCVAFDQAWQDEHRNSQLIIEEKALLSSQNGFWKEQSYAKDAALRSRDELLGKNFGVLANTQLSLADLSNRLLDVTGPGPRKIDVMSWKIPITYTFANVGKVQFWTLVVITNKSIVPIRGTLSCNADFTVIAENVLTHATSLRADYDILSPRSVHIEFAYPPVSAEHPLMFFASTKEGTEISECLFKLD
jgi:hypothetical protein